MKKIYLSIIYIYIYFALGKRFFRDRRHREGDVRKEGKDYGTLHERNYYEKKKKKRKERATHTFLDKEYGYSEFRITLED